MDIPVLSPKFEVTLHKAVKRDTIDGTVPVSVRYGQRADAIDLTPFFTDQSSITVSKSHRDPAGGFGLSVSDQPYSVGENGADADSLYGIVEPMDIIEIRLQHTVGAMAPTLVMRGFVSDVSRSMGVDQDGRPTRTVSISGQDYGKLWQMLQIFYGPGYVIGQDIISAYGMFERFGAGAKIGQSGAEFLAESVNKILNEYVGTVVSGNSGNPKSIEVMAQQKRGVTSIAGTQNQEGSLYDLLRQFLDVGTWNELFLTEDDEKVYCVYRPNAYLDIHGKPIDPATPMPARFNPANVDPTKLVYYEIDALRDVRSMDLSRTDANVSNYYWARAPRYEMVSDIYHKQAGVMAGDKTSIDLTGYVNSKANLYGIRKMEIATEMGGDDITNTSSGLKESAKTQRDTSVADWIKNRRELVVAANRDNVLLESGRITVKGNEYLRSGNYVRLTMGNFEAMYYIVSVEHQFSPFNRYETVLSVERGTGFVERMKKNGGKESPYYAEMAGS